MTSSPTSHRARIVMPEPAERARGQGDVLGLGSRCRSARERVGDDAPRLVLAELVGEPVLVARDRVALERVDQPGEWHLLWVAEREVGDARIEAVALPRARVEPLEDVGDAADHAVRPSFLDRHGRHLLVRVGRSMPWGRGRLS